MDYYSYLWLRDDGSPYYAGKGSGTRAFDWHDHRMRPPKDKSRILIFPQLNEAEAFESEIALIDLFGRKDIGTGCLRNLTNGGENPPPHKKGQRPTPQGLEKIRRRYANMSPEEKAILVANARLARAAKRKIVSFETRQKMSAAHKGKSHPCSDEVKAKLSALWKGKPWSEKRRKAQEKKSCL